MISTRPSLQVTPSNAFSSALSEILLLLLLLLLHSLFYLHVFDNVDVASSAADAAELLMIALCNEYMLLPLVILLTLSIIGPSVSLSAFSISSMSSKERGGKVLTIVNNVSSSMSWVCRGKTYTDKCSAPAMANAKLVLPVPGAP